MISRKYRFHGYGSLRYVYQHGKTVRGPVFALRYIKNERRKIFRVAVVVSKKVNKSAVVRNRIRRRLYEQVRLMSNQITEPHDLVITVFNQSVADMPAPELVLQLTNLLNQAQLIATGPDSDWRGIIEQKEK
jgi:ribonuclease P protein component